MSSPSATSTSGARASALRFDIAAFFTSAEEMFTDADLDAVVVAIPPEAQFGVSRDALEMGLHVLCCSPMTANARDARALGAVATEHRVRG